MIKTTGSSLKAVIPDVEVKALMSQAENLQPAAPKGEISGIYNLSVDARYLSGRVLQACAAVCVCFAPGFTWKAMDPVGLKRCT